MRTNVDVIIVDYTASVETLGDSITNLKGIRLLEALKLDKVGAGPYPDVTLFEAANRIMSDLVILHGVKWLLNHHIFPFESFTIEYGNEDKNGFDIRTSAGGKTLIGEAFNVAKSFFQIKKSAMLKKLRGPAATANFKIIMANHDAVQLQYAPKLRAQEFFVFVDIWTGAGRLVPNPLLNMNARQAT
ncbi:MAG: hypothetical protein ACLP9L_11790 [Thermoguttaceae bacterium]